MDRPPRNPSTDRLVSKRLISFAYLQIGVLQTAAGFLAFLTVLNDYGYNWNNLIGRGIPWETTQLICSPYFGSGGSIQATNCGFGCGEPATWVNQSTMTLYGQASASEKFCQYGCPIPFNGTADPFVEFSEFGFRGYAPTQLGGKDAAINAVCGRTCRYVPASTVD